MSREQVNLFKSDFKVVADYFVQMRENRDYTPSPTELMHVQETLQMLSVLTGDRRFEDVLNDTQEKGEVNNMCEVLDRIESRGINKGMQQGMQQGKTDERINNLRSLMQNMSWSPVQAMDALSIPASDRPKYYEFLKQ